MLKKKKTKEKKEEEEKEEEKKKALKASPQAQGQGVHLSQLPGWTSPGKQSARPPFQIAGRAGLPGLEPCGRTTPAQCMATVGFPLVTFSALSADPAGQPAPTPRTSRTPRQPQQ